MKKQILSLINAYHRTESNKESFISLFAACCFWLKMSEDNKLDKDLIFKKESTLCELLKLEVIGGDNDILFEDVLDYWPNSDLLKELMLNIQQLIKSNVVSYQDLSNAINEVVSEEKHKYLASIPDEICELGISLLSTQNGDVYCPFNGGYLFANKLPKESNKSLESLDEKDTFFARVHNELLDCNVKIHNSNPILTPYYIGDGGLKQFQSSLAFPPINIKYGNVEINDIWDRFPEKSLMGEVYHLRHMLAQSSDLVVCFVANSFLFRASAGERQFKQDLLDKNWLKTVISLPSNLLTIASIPMNIIVLDKNKTDTHVQFIDASNDIFIEKVTRTRNKLINIDQILSCYQTNCDSKISKSVAPSEIIEYQYNISPSRYVLSEEEQHLEAFQESHKTERLENLVEIIRPQAVKHADDGNHEFTEYNVTSINQIGSLVEAGKSIKVKSADLNKVSKQKIQVNDVLVVCKGAIGKVAIADTEIAENAIASQAFAILRIKPHIGSITSEALFQYLISEYGQLQLTSVATGTSALMISSKDLSMLQVPILNAEKLSKAQEVRKEIVDTYNTIEQLNNKISQLNNSWL